MKFHTDFIDRYVQHAPLALAIERWFECSILSRQRFERPILDLGCGDGVFSSVLFADPIDVGIDPDGGELARAKKRNKYLELVQCGGAAIPYAAGHFQTIFSNSVLEHIEDVESVLQEAHRLLAPGGRFYATVPSHLFKQYNLPFQLLSAARLDGAAEQYRRFSGRFFRQHHHYTPDGWQRLFARTGFDVVEHQEYAPREICMLNDFLTPFALPNLVTKKLSGRWFLVPLLRRLYAPLLSRGLKPLLREDRELEGGGILFFALTHARKNGQSEASSVS